LQIEEDTAAHLEIRWKASCVHRMASHVPSEWCRHHSLASTCLARSNNFKHKKYKKCEKYQNTPTTPKITQNSDMKIQKYYQILSLCFVSFKIKDVIHIYIYIYVYITPPSTQHLNMMHN
jgi:hypothetical protein